MKDIHKLIEEKAKAKLKTEIGKFISSIRENKLFSSVEGLKIILDTGESEEKEERESLRSFFWDTEHNAAKIIMKKLLPLYIELESKNFMEKVEQLSVDVEDLKSIN